MKMMIYFFQTAPVIAPTAEMVDKAFQASPTNAIGYGLLVVLMGFTIWKLWKKNAKLEEYIRQRDKEFMEYAQSRDREYIALMQKIETRLEDQQVMAQSQIQMMQKFSDLENLQKRTLEAIEKTA